MLSLVMFGAEMLGLVHFDISDVIFCIIFFSFPPPSTPGPTDKASVLG